MDERDLGKRLQLARQKAGLTQQELCHQANLSFSTLTKIERGAIKSPSIFTIQSIAGALHLGLDELIGNTVTGATRRQLLKTKRGVSFVYFDVNGCLVNFFQRAFARLAEDTGVPSDLIENAFWHFNDDVCRGEMSIDEFQHMFAARLDIEPVQWQPYYIEAVEAITEMHEMVAWAAERYKVGLLTNIMPGFLDALRHNGQVPNIAYDAIVDSSEVRAIKPEPKIYEIAQAKAGVPAEEILLIDDSRVNLMAAERLGWHVLWFDDARPDESVDRVRTALEPAQD